MIEEDKEQRERERKDRVKHAEREKTDDFRFIFECSGRAFGMCVFVVDTCLI